MSLGAGCGNGQRALQPAPQPSPLLSASPAPGGGHGAMKVRLPASLPPAPSLLQTFSVRKALHLSLPPALLWTLPPFFNTDCHPFLSAAAFPSVSGKNNVTILAKANLLVASCFPLPTPLQPTGTWPVLGLGHLSAQEGTHPFHVDFSLVGRGNP